MPDEAPTTPDQNHGNPGHVFPDRGAQSPQTNPANESLSVRTESDPRSDPNYQAWLASRSGDTERDTAEFVDASEVVEDRPNRRTRTVVQRRSVSPGDWTPDTVDDDGNPLYPDDVDRIEMVGDKACLVIIGNETHRLNNYDQLEDFLDAYLV